jgi:hypothetical protein
MDDESSAPRRRRAFLAGTAAATAGLAGCAGLTGDLSFDAGRATVSAAARAEAGYREAGITAVPYERQVSLGPISRTVRVTNLLAEYERSVGLDTGLGLPTDTRAAVFAVFATPKVDVFGRTLNPVGNLSTAELAELIQQQYGAIQDLSRDGELGGDLLGQSTTLTRFTAEADLLDGGVVSTDVPVYLYVGQPVEAGADFVLSVAAHPRAVGRQADTVRTLLAGVEHTVTTPTDAGGGE